MNRCGSGKRLSDIGGFLNTTFMRGIFGLPDQSRGGVSTTRPKNQPHFVSFFGMGLLLVSNLLAKPSLAADVSLSGFGSIGYTQSNQPFTYDRFISDTGTFRRDSILGLQVDAQFGRGIGATIQVKGAPSSVDDDKYEASVAWAFASYRPSNEWLLRAGRQRIPLYHFSQNYDVGATYVVARLPTEMYSIAPGNEFNGVSFSRVWSLGRSDLILDGYWGRAKVDGRFWFRDGVLMIQPAGPMFRQVSLEGKGFVGSYRIDDDMYRVGFHRSVGRLTDGGLLPATYPFVALSPGVGYFQTDSRIPGPGIPYVENIRNSVVTVSFDLALGDRHRIIAEFARTYVDTSNVKIANASDRGYVSLLKSIDRWTPYVTYAFLKSSEGQRSLYARVNGNSVPIAIPSSALINASQRAGADGMLTYDQRSLAIGTSYSLSPTSKIKAELMHVRIGQVSSLVDGPPGSNIRNQGINVISLSYSVVF